MPNWVEVPQIYNYLNTCFCWLTDWLTEWLTNRWTDGRTHWLTDWLTKHVPCRLVGGLTNSFNRECKSIWATFWSTIAVDSQLIKVNQSVQSVQTSKLTITRYNTAFRFPFHFQRKSCGPAFQCRGLSCQPNDFFFLFMFKPRCNLNRNTESKTEYTHAKSGFVAWWLLTSGLTKKSWILTCPWNN